MTKPHESNPLTRAIGSWASVVLRTDYQISQTFLCEGIYTLIAREFPHTPSCKLRNKRHLTRTPMRACTPIATSTPRASSSLCAGTLMHNLETYRSGPRVMLARYLSFQPIYYLST